jgi:hypothetical protein
LAIAGEGVVARRVKRNRFGTLGRGHDASARSRVACSCWTSRTNWGFDKYTAFLLDVEYLDSKRLLDEVS